MYSTVKNLLRPLADDNTECELREGHRPQPVVSLRLRGGGGDPSAERGEGEKKHDPRKNCTSRRRKIEKSFSTTQRAGWQRPFWTRK